MLNKAVPLEDYTMKKEQLFAVSLVSAMLSSPLMAEPMDRSTISVHGQPAPEVAGKNIAVGRTAGMDKYLSPDARRQDMTADTEIAAFEEVSDKAAHRPMRMDRIPGM